MLNLSKEEEFLVDVIFNEKKSCYDGLDSLDFEKLIKISSSHLLIPTFYNKIIEKKKLRKIPVDFKNYLQEIFLINKERNKKLLVEIDEISRFLNTNNINYVFLKGSALLSNNYFDNVGERMIGDIDIFVEENDIEKCIHVLKQFGYYNEHDYKKWDTNVLPNFINNKK